MFSLRFSSSFDSFPERESQERWLIFYESQNFSCCLFFLDTRFSCQSLIFRLFSLWTQSRWSKRWLWSLCDINHWYGPPRQSSSGSLRILGKRSECPVFLSCNPIYRLTRKHDHRVKTSDGTFVLCHSLRPLLHHHFSQRWEDCASLPSISCNQPLAYL